MSLTSLPELARKLESGTATSRELVETCLDRIQADDGEGARTFRTVSAESARQAADRIDAVRKTGQAPSPFAGIPVSVKDLFDVEGEATFAGSRILADSEPATRDAPSIARLRAQGFVFIGRTNMTEFAYSGLGLNPHYGTPLNPYDRATGRIPGGSSSGAGVSVADGMAAIALGTDTGGSCRIPAAFCGTVGFKPTARRIPRDGVTPLSFTLDSIGSLARTVACCAIVDAFMANETDRDFVVPQPASLRIGVLKNLVFEGTDDAVVAAFEASLRRLSGAGISIEDVTIDALDELPSINAGGGIAAAEAYALHRRWIAERASDYDPRVRFRIEKGQKQSAADYIDLMQHRERLMAAVEARTSHLDAIVYPTVPIVPPAMESIVDDDTYVRTNMRTLQNTLITNFLDRCAVSLPVHEPGEPPVGMNVMGRPMQDRELLAIAACLEAQLSR